MDKYYAVGITTILYPCYGVVITIVSKEPLIHTKFPFPIYLIAHALTSLRCASMHLGREGNGCTMNTYTTCLHFVQGGLQQWQINLCPNLHLQRGHAIT